MGTIVEFRLLVLDSLKYSNKEELHIYYYYYYYLFIFLFVFFILFFVCLQKTGVIVSTLNKVCHWEWSVYLKVFASLLFQYYFLRPLYYFHNRACSLMTSGGDLCHIGSWFVKHADVMVLVSCGFYWKAVPNRLWYFTFVELQNTLQSCVLA